MVKVEKWSWNQREGGNMERGKLLIRGTSNIGGARAAWQSIDFLHGVESRGFELPLGAPFLWLKCDR